jgi:hypothetical protein
MANTKVAKRISDEMWKKMADRRTAKQNAESWVRQADQNPAAKAFESARRAMFIAKTAGHGFVAPFTHAPANAFIPSRWADFWTNTGRTYKFVFDKTGHFNQMTDLEQRPNFTTAKRATLAVDPRRGYDEYQAPWMAKTLGKLGISGNRAFDALKIMRMDMFDRAWNGMSEADRTPEMAKALAEEINSSTGASKALSGQDWVSKGLSKALFAAPLEASRWEFLVRDNARALEAFRKMGLEAVGRGTATPEQRYMAKRTLSRNVQLIATYGSLLAMNQGLLTATGSKDKINYTDPSKPDFLSFKIAGHSVSPASGVLTAVKFIGTLAQQAMNADTKKPAQAAEELAKTAFRYGRSKLSPLYATGLDIGLRSDYIGRPLPMSAQAGTAEKPRYTWPEYLLTQQTPIPAGEAFRDAFSKLREQGMSVEMSKDFLKAAVKSLPVAAVASTGVRVTPAYEPREPKVSSKDRVAPYANQVRSGRMDEDKLQQLVDKGTISEKEKSEILKQSKMTVQESSFNEKKPKDALQTFDLRMTPTQREQVRDIMNEKVWSLLHSTTEHEDAAGRARRLQQIQRKVDQYGLEPTDPRKGKKDTREVSGMRQRVQSAFA